MFEGQLIRLMKIKEYGYADSVNRGLELFHSNPSRSVWIARFYDQDVFRDTVRSIEDHAEDLYTLVCETIPERLRAAGVDLGKNNEDYRVILIAHSMGGLVCRTLIQNLLPATKCPFPLEERKHELSVSLINGSSSTISKSGLTAATWASTADNSVSAARKRFLPTAPTRSARSFMLTTSEPAFAPPTHLVEADGDERTDERKACRERKGQMQRIAE